MRVICHHHQPVRAIHITPCRAMTKAFSKSPLTLVHLKEEEDEQQQQQQQQQQQVALP